jgi:membrane-bound serine protease (ClpP class)
VDRLPLITLYLALAAAAVAQSPAKPRVIAVDVDSIVHPVTIEIISHALDQAKQEHAALVLIRLNTPGGLLDASREIVQRIVSSPVPVVTYVTPSGARAASAGFFLLEAGDVAAMAPGTNTGAASPVLMGQTMDPVLRKKIENDTSAWLRSLTTKRGRNSELAEKTVTEAKAFTEKEALDQHLIDLIAPDERALLQQLDGRSIVRWSGSHETLKTADAEVVEAHRTWREQIISSIADPNVAFILLILGALGIYVEFTTPGLIFPGVLGGILALLGLSGLSVLPINWTGAALLCLSLALFVLEAKYTSHGILGIGGAVSMVLGALLLVKGPPEVRIHLTTALGVTIPFAVITIFLVSLVIRARAAKVITGLSSMVDEIGEARTPLAPDGKVMVRGEYWNATSSTPLDPGTRVRVTAVNGLTLTVEPLPPVPAVR